MLLLFSASTKTIKAQQSVANIGDVSEVYGNAQILRDKTYNAKLKFNIQSNDEAITTDGRMAIRCLLYTSPSPRDRQKSRMPSSA